MSTLTKPILRGHCHRHAIKTMGLAAAFATLNAAGYYFFIARPKKEAYHRFLRTYDEQAHFKELVKYNMLTHTEKLTQKRSG